ncbi:MAG: phage tail sheath family protein [Synergistaceae bacterium]|nr:phage tail sheath family protein [Synergistaceae bacterium]MBR0251386.1 phage tail sheath family protein [Synergistaceae bacterium]
MAFRHGVYKSEVPTSIIPPSQINAGLPVIVGTAPVYMCEEMKVNEPVLVYSYEEAVKALGYSSDWKKYTLCEFMYSQFALFAKSPAVMINVFDPESHKENVNLTSYSISDGEINLGQDVMLSKGLTFETGKNYVQGEDYECGYDDSGNAVVSIITGGKMSALTGVKIGHVRAKPESVSADEIIGGIEVSTGKHKGLECINDVFPKFRLIPGLIGSPKYSCDSGVAGVMRAKAENINGIFTGQAVIDIPCDSANADVYTEVPEWKNKHNYMAEREIVCWPKVKLADKIFHLSTQLIGLMNQVDSEHDDVPYKSPSNELLQMDSCVNDAGEEIMLGLEQANYLNSQGIVTCLNFMSGWAAWGNRTGCYPGNTDPKDAFIPVRRMFDYVGNLFITTFWQRVDAPVTVRLIRQIVNSFNLVLNGMQAREMILGGRVEFKESENVLTDLMNGILKFHVYMTPPVPAEVIEGILEFDPEYMNTLFEGL